jgi:acetolactate synthase-1/2/3 large subunit
VNSPKPGVRAPTGAEPLIHEPTPVPEVLVRVLEDAGIEYVFGMPGGATGLIYRALASHTETIRTVLVRSESLGSVMAEVHGRLTGLPGVLIGQGAFLLANGALGALEAHLGSSPMVLLGDLTDGSPYSHHAPYQAGTGDYGAWDARRSFEGFTKHVFVADEPAQAVQVTQLALKHAMSGEPGPVAVLYHSTALRADVGPESRPRLYKSDPYLEMKRPAPHAEDVERAARILVAAERPVIIAGNGARGVETSRAILQLAEMLDIPVATTSAGKGVVAETHPLALGTIGNFGLGAAHEEVGSADLILAVGTKLSPTDTANESPRLLDPTRQRFIQIEIEPRNAAWTFPVDHVLLGDAKEVLLQLAAAANVSDVVTSNGRSRVEEAHRRHGSYRWAESFSDEVPITPQRAIRELQESLPRDAVITCDAGENRIFMSHYFRTSDGATFLQPASIGCMGYALPAALSAKVIHADRTCVAVCGDGGFGISINGLLTAVEENIPIVVVVLNNAALGWVIHAQGDERIASKFGEFDYSAIAKQMGCFAVRVQTADEFGPALERAIESDKPSVIEVVTSLDQPFTKVVTPLLSGD